MSGRPRPADRFRAALAVLGELLVTIGVVLGLLAVYQVWWTDIESARAQQEADEQLERRWNGEVVDDGTAFARLYIPAFGSDFRFAVVSGTTADALEIGPGHYTETQAPGEPGNFAVAGHRVGRGAPFNDLDALRGCDALVYATAQAWLVYRVLPVDPPDREAARDQASRCLSPELAERATSGVYEGLSGISIVQPGDAGVINPVPNRSDPAGPDLLPLTTLTTCHPQYSASERLIVHAVLDRIEPRVPGRVPAELRG